MFKGKRSVIVIVLAIVFLIVTVGLAVDYKYVGSKNSNKYHYPTCKSAQKIKPGNLVTFNSAKDAQAAGYVPCKMCKPPFSD